ncbi:MAG: peptide ABC transporter substrate-binding protein, partial [Rhodospirillaceae bacterium]|nr:peptide ABC transporter substrate-binding protein [Rhodospirillaceae bacterium]
WARATGAGATARDRLVIGMTQYPATFNPDIDTMLAKSYLLGFTMRPFTQYDADWRLTCFLCTELPTLENGRARIEDLGGGRQGIAATYTIRPGATWGDGTPVTTDDVMFTYEVGRDPRSGVTNAELYRRILKIDVVDAKTFTMHFDRVEFQYNAINDFMLLPAHLERAAFADPAAYRNRTTFDTDPTNPGLWFGPYRVVAAEPGAQIVLEANPTWWGSPPAFRRIVIKAVENTAALEANLLSGSIDMIAGEAGLSLDQALSFETRHADAFDVVYKPALFYEHLDVNLDNPVLADRRVRQALLLALDREAMNRRLFGGRQAVAATFMNPLDGAYSADTATYPYDPKRAAALLDEAGWTPGPDGVRVRDGRRLSLEVMTTAGDRTRELIEQVLQSQWKAVGVELRIRNEPARVFFAETVTKRRFPDLALFAWLSGPEQVPRSTLHSAEIPTEANGWTGQNYTGFRDAEMDGLIDRIEVELDREKRAPLWRRIQQIYAEELPALPLYFRAQAFILPKWLKGVTPTGHLGPSTLWVEQWHADE